MYAVVDILMNQIKETFFWIPLSASICWNDEVDLSGFKSHCATTGSHIFVSNTKKNENLNVRDLYFAIYYYLFLKKQGKTCSVLSSLFFTKILIVDCMIITLVVIKAVCINKNRVLIILYCLERWHNICFHH